MILRTILRYISLKDHVEDYATIHDSISRGIEFKGVNLWILVFAISMICVGLNINSPAVIIGAMLISPMMGPIIGIGYCIATYDFELFKRALRNFVFAASAGLATSTLYFVLSPVSTASSELLSLTHPTIYDVFVAFLGGLAAIVAISNRHKGNVIAGAAIATALMPPLCTAGYGLATAQFQYLFGAIYLFVINAVFIGISSTLISKFLKLPIRKDIAPGQRKIINRWIWVVISATALPSIYLGFKLVQEERFKENAANFTNSVSIYQGNYLLDHYVYPNKHQIKLIYGGNSLTPEDKEAIKMRASDFSLKDAEIEIQQGFSFDGINNAIHEADNLKSEVARLKMAIDGKQQRLDSLQNRTVMGKQLLSEIQALFPDIESCHYSEGIEFSSKNVNPDTISIIGFSSKAHLSKQEEDKLQKWLQNRLNSKKIRTYFSEKE